MCEPRIHHLGDGAGAVDDVGNGLTIAVIRSWNGEVTAALDADDNLQVTADAPLSGEPHAVLLEGNLSELMEAAWARSSVNAVPASKHSAELADPLPPAAWPSWRQRARQRLGLTGAGVALSATVFSSAGALAAGVAPSLFTSPTPAVVVAAESEEPPPVYSVASKKRPTAAPSGTASSPGNAATKLAPRPAPQSQHPSPSVTVVQKVVADASPVPRPLVVVVRHVVGATEPVVDILQPVTDEVRRGAPTLGGALATDGIALRP